MEKLLILLLLGLSAANARYVQTFEYFPEVRNCEVSIEYPNGDLPEPQPLVLTDSAEPNFVLPRQRKLLSFPSNSSLLLACPGKKNFLKILGPGRRYARAVCLEGTRFMVKSAVYEFHDFACARLPRETIVRSEQAVDGCGGSSDDGGHFESYRIGFRIEDADGGNDEDYDEDDDVKKNRGSDRSNYHLPLIDVCRDNVTLRTHYANTTVSRQIHSYQSYPRPYWRYGPYYPGYGMSDVYKVEWQLRSVERLLGSAELARKYIRTSGGGQPMFLNRGHLTAKADFVYGAQQSATFWLLNTAPQWSSFNSGNWMIAERDVRQLAMDRQLDLRVYTGVHGVTSLRDAEGVERPLYLHANETHRAFAVPRYYWKVIHEPRENLAVALVGLNEPYAKGVSEDMFLCRDLQEELDFRWLKWRPRVVRAGVSYVCEVGELRKAVSSVPDLGETGLLI